MLLITPQTTQQSDGDTERGLGSYPPLIVRRTTRVHSLPHIWRQVADPRRHHVQDRPSGGNSLPVPDKRGEGNGECCVVLYGGGGEGVGRRQVGAYADYSCPRG